MCVRQQGEGYLRCVSWAVPFVFSGGPRRVGGDLWIAGGSPPVLVPSLRSVQMWACLLWLLWRVHLRQCLTGRGALRLHLFFLSPPFACTTVLNPNCGEVLHLHSVSVLSNRLTLSSHKVVVSRENICKTFGEWCIVNCFVLFVFW